MVLFCHYQALRVGGFVQPGTCSPHPPVSGPPALLLPQIQPTLDSVAGERGWQWTSLAGQAPRQAPSWHSGARSSQQPLPGNSSCFPTWCPPRGGWEPMLLPARPHRRISLGKCPAAKGAVPVLRGPCYRWGSPPRGRAPPVPLLQGLIAGKINCIHHLSWSPGLLMGPATQVLACARLWSFPCLPKAIFMEDRNYSTGTGS